MSVSTIQRMIVGLVVVFAAGCASNSLFSGSNTIEGSVTYRERMMVPPEATVSVVLEDVSRADAPSIPVAKTAFPAEGAPPWDFELSYDPSKLQERHRYNLRARIKHDDELLFVTKQAYRVVPDQTAKPFNLMLSRVIGDDQPEASAAPPLNGTYWQLTHIRGDAVKTDTGSDNLNIIFKSKEQRVAGFSGCNQFSGAYRRDGNELTLEKIAATMKACMDGMERERAFRKALGETTRFQTQGTTMTLLNADDDAILRFEASPGRNP